MMSVYIGTKQATACRNSFASTDTQKRRLWTPCKPPKPRRVQEYSTPVLTVQACFWMYLFAVSGGQGAVAVLGEPELHGYIQREGVLVLREGLDDAEDGMDPLVRAGGGDRIGNR